MSFNHYTPVLKSKMGELSALAELEASVWGNITPLIEVTPPAFDYVEGAYSKGVEQHLSDISAKVVKAFEGHPRLFLDLADGFDGVMEPIEVPDSQGTGLVVGLREEGLQPIPVLVPGRRRSFQQALSDNAQDGIAVRATLEQIDPDDAPTREEVKWTLELALGNSQGCHLMLDLRSIGDVPGISTSQWRRLVRGALAGVERLSDFDSVTLLASSFPKDLSGVGADTYEELPRIEWALWKSLVESPSDQVTPRFGDYPISHPQLMEIDPRLMRMSANIRYTTPENWLLVKGRNVRDYGYAQFNELAELLVNHPMYSGRTFSWGDGFIAQCAEGTAGPGNATTWRKVGTNHHITLVAGQVASLGGAES